MQDNEHHKILNKGVKVWNKWRENHPEIKPKLVFADLNGVDLSGVNLSNANLNWARLESANLAKANLIKSYLYGAHLEKADLSRADLGEANLSHAILKMANLSRANLEKVNLWKAQLNHANLMYANLKHANLSYAELRLAKFGKAEIGFTTFGSNDLSTVKGLDDVVHRGPSIIDIDTLYKSSGMISDDFLRDCGVPEDFIVYLPSLLSAEQIIQFYSCFISYSHKDEEFAKRLHSRMRQARLRVWFAPEDIRGGEKLYEQIDQAIRYYDKLLIVLSENSLQSEWVMTEIRKARKSENENKRRKLFPIRLVNFDTLKKWECFDADIGKDLAVEVREYYIPDFSDWKDHDAFEASFKRLLKDLQSAEKK
jgi:hypothetical protein